MYTSLSIRVTRTRANSLGVAPFFLNFLSPQSLHTCLPWLKSPELMYTLSVKNSIVSIELSLPPLVMRSFSAWIELSYVSSHTASDSCADPSRFFLRFSLRSLIGALPKS